MKVKPVKEKRSINYPKLAVITAAVSLTSALSGCIEYQDMPAIGRENPYLGSTSGDESSDATFMGKSNVPEDCSSSDCSEIYLTGYTNVSENSISSEYSDESKNISECSDENSIFEYKGVAPVQSN